MKNVITFLCIIVAIVIAQNVSQGVDIATEMEKFTQEIWKSGNDTLSYSFRAPDEISQDNKYPLLFFLHGSGGRGDNNQGQLLDANGIGAFASQRLFSKHSSYVFAPQVPEGERWVDVPWNTTEHRMPSVSKSMSMALEALDAFIANTEHQVDPHRIYVMGLSMGGYGTWDAIQRRPDYFAAAVPICGGGDAELASAISDLPIWAWHGDIDSVIPAARSRQMIRALEAADGSPIYTEVEGRGHDVWVDVWSSRELWDWLYEQK